MDWEDINKAGFIVLVQTLVLKDASIDGESACDIVHEAMRVSKVSVPPDIREAAKELVAYLTSSTGNAEPPAWFAKAKRPLFNGAF
jgi:hypothetical protein